MRTLITGAGGFVGPHLCSAIGQAIGPRLELVPTSQAPEQHPKLGPLLGLDITDKCAVVDTIARLKPDCVVHLAGIAAPVAASADWRKAWHVHVEGTLNIAYAIMAHAPQCILIFVGSGQIYGHSARTGAPLDEETLLAPVDNYGVTKAAADLALGALAQRGLRVIRIRPFNHTGAGQTENFFVPSVAMQIARIEAGVQPPIIWVGNLTAERDFLHVADVAEAYSLAIRHAAELPPGTILNIASGLPVSMQAVMDRLIAASRVAITVEQDPARLRASDLPRIVGDASRVRRLLGWKPRRSLDEALSDVLTACRARITAA
ncbi:NAD-dependent epimerase/dehydratase family protein [Rhodoplanes sp. SY1]|uniref:NAD-dependent epimerase/dehydratase family protein n=1 Tax=Rhodoplanes sp. SY1 TaxID=3166646 RepID=UPI0038B4AAB1